MQNAQNRNSYNNTTSKYKGVSWHKKISKWKSHIRVDKYLIHLGYYWEEEDAARAYNKAANEYFGEFANLNNVDDWKDFKYAPIRFRQSTNKFVKNVE